MIKPTRCTIFPKLFLEWNWTCIGQFPCPSSGFLHCTYSNGICHICFLTLCEQDPARKLSANLYSTYPLASLSGILSQFYTTPASHQPKPLGFSQRYIVALLHDSRSSSAKPPWLLSAVHRRTPTWLPLHISQTSLASLSGTSSHLYMTHASHQPNLLGISQRHIVQFYTILAWHQPSLFGIYPLRVSHTSLASTSGTMLRLFTATTFLQLDFFRYLSGTPPHSWAATVHKSYPPHFLQLSNQNVRHTLLYGIYEVHWQ